MEISRELVKGKVQRDIKGNATGKRLHVDQSASHSRKLRGSLPKHMVRLLKCLLHHFIVFYMIYVINLLEWLQLVVGVLLMPQSH